MSRCLPGQSKQFLKKDQNGAKFGLRVHIGRLTRKLRILKTYKSNKVNQVKIALKKVETHLVKLKEDYL
jgi:hypothetical protein